jgi:hypothetical protein
MKGEAWYCKAIRRLKEGLINNKAKIMIAALLMCLTLGLITMIVPVRMTYADAPPGVPSQYYGWVKNNGTLVGSGYSITAQINGATVATTITDQQGRYGYATAFYVNANPGDNIQFYVNGVAASQTATNNPGAFEVDLTVSGAPTSSPVTTPIPTTTTTTTGGGGSSSSDSSSQSSSQSSSSTGSSTSTSGGTDSGSNGTVTGSTGANANSGSNSSVGSNPAQANASQNPPANAQSQPGASPSNSDIQSKADKSASGGLSSQVIMLVLFAVFGIIVAALIVAVVLKKNQR